LRICHYNAVNMAGGTKRGVLAFASVALALLTVVVFSQVRGFSFLAYDDQGYLTENRAVLQGLSREGLRWAFTTFHAANWHPLTWISHMADVTLFGTDPAGHHLHNLALHLFTGIALFLVLAAMTGTLWRSWFVAALFLLHPLHVEPVAWISERKEVLSALLGATALGAWLRYSRSPSPGRYLAAGLFVALALSAKPMAVTLPLLLFLLDLWPLARFRGLGLRTLALEKVPLLALAAVASILTLRAQASAGALQAGALLTPVARIANAVGTPFLYLRRALFPAGLNVFYPHPGEAFSLAFLAGGLAALIAVSALAAALFRSRPFLLIGWLWYLAALLPVSGLIQAGFQSGADRYTYVPLTGVFVAAIWSIHATLGIRRAQATATAALGCAALLSLAAVSHLRLGDWRDEATLFSRAVTIRPDDYDAHAHLGAALLARGDTEAAVRHLREAVRQRPRSPENQAKLADALQAAGLWREAVDRYRLSLALDPGQSGVWNNLGVALVRLDDADQARAAFQHATESDPANAEAWNNLGALLLGEGAVEEAVLHFDRALEIDPVHRLALANRAAALRRAGREAEAREAERALQQAAHNPRR
jgi:tetratricopeptide (TPR) repeat protein